MDYHSGTNIPLCCLAKGNEYNLFKRIQIITYCWRAAAAAGRNLELLLFVINAHVPTDCRVGIDSPQGGLENLVGMIGGYMVSIHILNIDAHHYVEQTRNYMDGFRIFSGVTKSFFFGAIIAVFCCWRGLVTHKGAEGVGRATTHANVLSAIGILISNFFLTIILNSIYLNLYA